jgi:hypothetical protein
MMIAAPPMKLIGADEKLQPASSKSQGAMTKTKHKKWDTGNDKYKEETRGEAPQKLTSRSHPC